MLKQICGFCKGGPEKNKYGEEEDLLSCNDCGNSGKPDLHAKYGLHPLLSQFKLMYSKKPIF